MIPRFLAIGIIVAADVVAILVASGVLRFDRRATSPEKPFESASVLKPSITAPAATAIPP